MARVDVSNAANLEKQHEEYLLKLVQSDYPTGKLKLIKREEKK